MASDKTSRAWFSKPKNLALIAGCAIIAVLFAMNLMYQEPIDESFLQDYDEFDSYEQINQDPVVYEVSLEGSPTGYLVMTSHYGYQSDITMATLVGMDGTVLDARAYAQGETPSYFRKLIGGSFFKDNFVGDPISEGFSINENVDAISHATISSNASTKAVEEGVAYVGEHYLNTDVERHDNQIGVGYLDVLVFAMLILALATTILSKNKVLVWICRVYSIVVMGFIAAQFITLTVLIALFSLDWPSIIDYLRWYLLVFGVLALVLATGKNVYCQRICPFGALEEVVFAFGGTIGKKPLNPRVGKILRWGPGLLLFASLALSFGFHSLDFASYEPFSLIFGQVGVGIQWALLPLVLLGALFSRRIYCNFACPVGYVLTKIVVIRSKVAKFVRSKAKKQEASGVSSAKPAAENGEDADAASTTLSETGDRPSNSTTRSTARETAEDGSDGNAPHKKGKAAKPMKPYDWLVLILGLAIIIISLLSILMPLGIFGA